MRTTFIVRVFSLFNRHKVPDNKSTPTLSSSVNETELALQVMREKNMIMSATNVEGQDEVYNKTPLLHRKWVKAPLSRLSTTASRRDWFRIMELNFMTDCWNDLSLSDSNVKYSTKEENKNATNENTTPNVQVRESHKTTPVCGVRVNNEHSDMQKNYNNNNNSEETCIRQNCQGCLVDKSTTLPFYLSPEYRQQYLLALLRQYDPDVVTLNEVNRLFFHHYLWRHVRYLGYGMLYNSSRGARVKLCNKTRTLNDGANCNLKSTKCTYTEKASNRFEFITPEEDIGNVVIFHKGRFCPILMPGEELPRHLYFAQFVSLRDRVTNMTLNIALVQFTAGRSEEAAALRTYEARQTLMVLDSINRSDSDRAHMSNVVCGDFNNEEMDEECIKLMQERFFSTYDLVGGPRWTTWHFKDKDKCQQYKQKYYSRNVQEWKLNSLVTSKETEIQNYIKNKKLAIDCLMHTTDVAHVKEDGVTKNRSDLLSPAKVKINDNQVDKSVIEEEAATEPSIHLNKELTNDHTIDESNEIGDKQNIEQTTITKYDAMELIKEEEMKRGVVKRTQDYIFHEPFTLALHGVLDIPDNNSISQNQLLPNAKSPSHHIPLVIDVSFNNIHPEVTDLSMKP